MHFQVRIALLALLWCGVVSAQIQTVTGVHTGVDKVTGARPLRRNILDVQQDVPTWSLYIQALTAMQRMSQDDLLSYYQIAGIHGRPFIAYNDVGADAFRGSNSWPAYCEHNSILFPIWHRPYMAMYEQALATHVQAIAAQYQNGTQRTIYQKAADNFRVPYWDWASSPSMPDILNVKTVQVTAPSGGMQTVTNPLYDYAIPNLRTELFPTDASDGYLAWDPRTLRNPTASNVSQPGVVNAAMEAGGFKSLVYNLFTRVTDYPTFATDINSGTSIEIIHGAVHNNVGGSTGHMTPLSYSAFDPIFFLHHANVDRLFAIWQALYPNQWIPKAGQANQLGTYTIPYGATENSSTSLTPFFSSVDGRFWTSDTARALPQWGYSYPEISDWSQTAAQLTTNVTALVNRLYGSSPIAAAAAAPTKIPPTGRTKSSHTRSGKRTPSSLWNETQTTEWYIQVSVDKMALNGDSFNVRFFLGVVPNNTAVWCHAPNLIGTMTSLVPASARLIGASKARKYAELPITSRLGLAKLTSMDVNTVGPFLAKNLAWRVQKIDGSIVDISSVASLKVQISSEVVTPSNDASSFPIYGKATIHDNILRKRTRGVRLI